MLAMLEDALQLMKAQKFRLGDLKNPINTISPTKDKICPKPKISPTVLKKVWEAYRILSHRVQTLYRGK